MGYLKDLLLENPPPVTVEQRFQLTRAVGNADIKVVIAAFRERALGDVRGRVAILDDEGRAEYPILPFGELETHLGSRRVNRFEISAKDAQFKQFALAVKADGYLARVKASALSRDGALGMTADAAKALGLVAVGPVPAAGPKRRSKRENDAFVVHATKDKATVARPIHAGLQARGYRIWMDEFTLKVGDSLRRKIDEGLTSARFGIVIVSPAFFAREWPQRELDALFSKELVQERKVILPVWHELDQEVVSEKAPLIAGRIAVHTAKGVDHVVRELAKAMGTPVGMAKASAASSARRLC